MAKNTITRDAIARAIKRDAGVNIKKASELFDQILEIIADAIKKEKTVAVRLFGSFSNRQKKQRIGRNPKTMEEAIIPARKTVRFKISPTLKKRINDNINSYVTK